MSFVVQDIAKTFGGQKVLESVSLQAGVENLFDENYETSYGFPRAGRSAQIGASIDF